MRAPLLRVLVLLAAPAILASPLACSSGVGPTSPVECGAGTVTCAMDSICCPASDPYFCGGPSDPDYLGCYATMQQASSVCEPRVSMLLTSGLAAILVLR